MVFAWLPLTAWNPSFSSPLFVMQLNQNNKNNYCILPLQHSVRPVLLLRFLIFALEGRTGFFKQKAESTAGKKKIRTQRQRCCKHNKPFVSCSTPPVNRHLSSVCGSPATPSSIKTRISQFWKEKKEWCLSPITLIAAKWSWQDLYKSVEFKAE